MESVVGANGWVDRKSRSVVNGRFRVGPMIRFSQFGAVYHGTDTFTKQLVEIKLENVNAEYPVLIHESEVYNRLKGGAGISKVRWIGVEGDHNALVMDVLGLSLDNFFTCCSKKFCLKTVLMLAEKMVDIFSLAKQYRDTSTHQHIPYRDGKKWKHNVAYSSINAHRGVEQGCRDDLESLGYVLTYFLRGSLPWQEVSANTREEEFEKMCEIKESISIEELCQGYPTEFAAYLNYCRSLRFDEKPDYAYLRKLFRRLFDRKGYRRDLKYDWVRNPACLLSEEGIDVARRLYRKVVLYCPRNKNAGPVIKHCN
ncbi:hypothetical protein C1H46_029979 [Malus baccata]|uniref:Uncharacterized protein n=1 Tax=Malus baccata TaxID=106549 RepID=A0A540LDA2_MALBA|nr:hypothetical protein C1H46_029979 [Malus baccata]